MTKYIMNIAVALSQLLNAVLGGNPKETLTARLSRSDAWYAKLICKFLGWIDPGHCG